MVPELEEYSLHMPIKIYPYEQLTCATVESESHKVAKDNVYICVFSIITAKR